MITIRLTCLKCLFQISHTYIMSVSDYFTIFLFYTMLINIISNIITQIRQYIIFKNIQNNIKHFTYCQNNIISSNCCINIIQISYIVFNSSPNCLELLLLEAFINHRNSTKKHKGTQDNTDTQSTHINNMGETKGNDPRNIQNPNKIHT